MKVFSLFCISTFVLVMFAPSQVQSISTYQQCLDCFYQNRTNFFYCQQRQQCLSIRQRNCPVAQMVMRETGCLEGWQDCTNVTYTDSSVGTVSQYAFGLPPGQGCYIQIDRIRNGSYGTMTVNYDDPSILVFDNEQRDYQSGTELGLPLTDYGWGPRKILVVNRGQNQARFAVLYQSAMKKVVENGILALLLFSLMFSFL